MAKALWPPRDARLEQWLAEIEKEHRYRIVDIAEIIGSGASTIRKMLQRDSFNETQAGPSGYDDQGRYWGYQKARALVRFIAQEVRLPDAFDEPMLLAEEVAERLGYANAGSLKHAVSVGNAPAPDVPPKGRLRALWKEAAVDAEAEARES